MELGTFGAIFQAAIKVEEGLIARYEAQSGAQPDPALYHKFVKEGQKRLKRLERLRRETVTEMILEPIHDLRLSDALVDFGDIDAAVPFAPAQARELELQIGAFYDEAADKIGQAEAARALRRLGKESVKRAARLAPG
jgi:hypothetical protein